MMMAGSKCIYSGVSKLRVEYSRPRLGAAKDAPATNAEVDLRQISLIWRVAISQMEQDARMSTGEVGRCGLGRVGSVDGGVR